MWFTDPINYLPASVYRHPPYAQVLCKSSILLFLQCPKSPKYRQDSPSVPTITSSTPTLLTDHNNARVSPSLCSTSSPCTHDSRVDPGQKDPSSINVTLTLDQFRQLQDEVATCHQRMKEEEDKRRKMELKITKVK